MKATRTTRTHAKRPARSRSEASEESLRTRPVSATPATWESFSEGFDRSFARVYAYVSRRTSDPRTCEHIVADVLEGALELLVRRRDDQLEFRLLKGAADRRLAAHGLEPRPNRRSRDGSSDASAPTPPEEFDVSVEKAPKD